MCNIISMNIGGRTFRAADIKQNYIENIIKQAGSCDKIRRIVLFGSVTENRCARESDIDVAVFGDEAESKVLKSKSYKDFVRGLFSYDFSQDYDILYFRNGTSDDTAIMKDINKGALVYERN